MRLFPLVVAVLGLVACDLSRHKPKAASPRDERVELLRQRLFEVREQLALASDPVNRWPAPRECDGLLWSGLAAAGGVDVNLQAAEYAPGEMHRRPAPSCFEGGEDHGSKSTISRDMLTGYLWGVWRQRDRGAAERLAAYGEAHDWVMGGGDPFRTGMGSNLKGLLGRILVSVGGPSREYRHLPALYVAGGKDYERHLKVLSILLEGEVTGSVSGDHLAVLKAEADDDPTDGLFQAARGVYTGDMELALTLLLDPAYAAPGYVRPRGVYELVHFVFAADTVVRAFDL